MPPARRSRAAARAAAGHAARAAAGHAARLVVVLLLLVPAASACAACAGRQEHVGPEATVALDLSAGGDPCSCEFLFTYSAGPTPGRVRLEATPGVAAVAVYGDIVRGAPIAEFAAADMLQGATVYSTTGELRVVVVQAAGAAGGVSIATTAINQAPTLEPREGFLVNEGVFGLLDTLLLPWGEVSPLPFAVSDPDNQGEMRGVIELITSDELEPVIDVVLPSVAGVDVDTSVQETEDGVLVRRWVLTGPGRLVEGVLNGAGILPIDLERDGTDQFSLTVNDLGNSGEGGVPLVASDAAFIATFPSGVVDIPRGGDLLNSGDVLPENEPVAAVFLVHDAYRIDFLELNLPSPDADGCLDFLRVFDGPSTSTGRLLSTELFPSGEICGESNLLLPSYIGTTGEFVVEFESTRAGSHNFGASTEPTPLGFQAWLLDGQSTVEVAVDGAPVRLPRVMVTALPDPAHITVNVTAAVGRVGLEFADSFVDLVRATAPLSLALTAANGAPAMLRMGEALGELVYVPAPSYAGDDTVTVRAWSGGEEAAVLEVAVQVQQAAINAPASLSVHAAQPVPVAVSVAGGQDLLSVQVATTSGVGRVSVDHRAALWVDIGYQANVTVVGTTAEVNAELGSLVYKGLSGGTDTIVVSAGGSERTIAVEVDPECLGDHVLYGREGSFTELVGPRELVYSPETVCTWLIVGPRLLAFPYFEVPPASSFTVRDESGNRIFVNSFQDPGILRAEGGFLVDFDALNVVGRGFVGEFQRQDGVNDPPVIVVPRASQAVVRGSTTRLRGLYIDDFADGPIHASLETTAGSFGTTDTRLVEIDAASFDELDAWVTGVDFAAGDEQTVAKLTLSATDADGETASSEFLIEVLPCSGLAEVAVADGSQSARVADGSGPSDYTAGLVCTWRLTGAPAPATLGVEFLDLDCAGDTVTVYDGSSAAGRELGSFCRAEEVAGAVGTLVSSTGSFFVALTTDRDGLEDDGFSLVYGGMAARAATALGPAPGTADPERAYATVVALDGASVLVFGGHNGVRAVRSTLVFEVGRGWQALVSTGPGPSARQRAGGAAVSRSQVIVHGGENADGAALAETWTGAVDTVGGTISWSDLDAGGPATAGASVHTHDGVVWMVDASGVWTLGVETAQWRQVGPTPPTVTATSSAYRASDGAVYAAGTDGTVWTLSLDRAAWTETRAQLESGCTAWACSGAMLGGDEFVVGGSRVNVTSLAVDALPAAASGQTVGGTYLDQPALFVYRSGTMSAVALTLGVSSHSPRVSPSSGDTVVVVSGERLSSCDMAACEFGSRRVFATVETERTASCRTPAGPGPGPGLVSVAVVCEDGRRYGSPEPLAYYAEPRIEAVEPAAPQPGETVLVSLGGVPAETLALVEAPLCRFGVLEETAVVDGSEMRCRVPTELTRGATTMLQVSLDGQQFGSPTPLALATRASGDLSLVIVVASVSAAFVCLLAVAVLRYKRLAARVDSGPAPWEIPFERLDLCDVLGTGSYGAVHRGRYRGGEVAIKIIKEAGDTSEEAIEAFRKESALMAELRHPNIVLFMGACTTPPNIAIVLEFLPNGSLFELIHEGAYPIGPHAIRSFALDIVKGMAYLHGADPPIVHRDLKSPNVLVDKSWTMKVSDFGLTEVFDAGGGRDQAAAGSVFWMAPEVLRGEGADTFSDVYSFAVTLWEIVTRDIPYHGQNPGFIANRVARDPDFRPLISVMLEELVPFTEIIRKCWAANPSSRPTFDRLRQQLDGMELQVEDVEHRTWKGTVESGSSVPGPPSDGISVAMRVDGAVALWEQDPVAMRSYLDVLDGTVTAEVGTGHRGPGPAGSTVVVFDKVPSAVSFALKVLLQLDEALPVQFQVAFGIAQGGVSSAGGMIQGSGVDAALALARSAPGGQVVARRALVGDGVDSEALGFAVALADGTDDTVVLYPEALKDRHGQTGAAAGPTFGEPSWVIDVRELELGALIGVGSFGTVYKAMWRGASVSAKELHRKRLGPRETLDLQMEGGVASRLRHPNVCLFLGVCKDAAASKMYVVSEYMSKGSVFDAIVTTSKDIAVKAKIKVAKGMALGLRYLHEQEPAIVHRSLTARNVLLGEDWTAKLSDFGLARVKDGAATMTKIGSTAYSAPELLRGERYDERADVYAYGVVVWEMVAQEPAWADRRLRQIVDCVSSGQRPEVRDEWRSGEERGLIEVVERCWKAEAKDRPTAAWCADQL